MTRPTDHSLPGIGWALMTTTSPSSMRNRLLSPVAINESADIGSPWEPVEMTQICPSERRSTSSMSTSVPSGIDRMPRRTARSTFLPIDRPSVATRRPLATAASMTCWTRWMWLAKQATTTRWPAAATKTRRMRHADGALRRREAGFLGVRRVGQQEADARAGREGADPGQVGPPAVDRQQVELEVAGVQEDALGGVERDGERVGHRVGDRDELDVARPDTAALTVGDGDVLRPIGQPGLVDPVAGQAEREGRAVDRDGQVAQQERQPAGVVLVPVGEHDAVDAVRVLPEVREVGEDEVDAGHVGVGEHDPAVEDEDPAVDFDAGAVAADLAEAAEEDDADRLGLGGSGGPSGRVAGGLSGCVPGRRSALLPTLAPVRRRLRRVLGLRQPDRLPAGRRTPRGA